METSTGCESDVVPSDRYAKVNFAAVDTGDILDRLSNVPITTWTYKDEGSEVRHIGPMAQDFSAAFEVGGSDKFISTVDANGVSMAALQELHRIVQKQDSRIVELEADLGQLKQAKAEPSTGILYPLYLASGLILGGLAVGGLVLTRSRIKKKVLLI